MRSLFMIAPLLVIVAASGGCSKDAGEEAADKGEEAEDTAEGGWPQDVLEGFRAQCKQSGKGEDFCACSARELQEQIPWSEMEPHEDLFAKAGSSGSSAREAASELSPELGQKLAAAMRTCQERTQ